MKRLKTLIAEENSLGYRIRNHLLEIIFKYQTISVNHLIFVPFYAKRPIGKMVQGEDILSLFPTHNMK